MQTSRAGWQFWSGDADIRAAPSYSGCIEFGGERQCVFTGVAQRLSELADREPITMRSQ